MPVIWDKIIIQLRETPEAQLTDADIAERVGVSQPTIHRLRTGKSTEPRFGLGQRLLQLHQQLRPDLHESRVA